MFVSAYKKRNIFKMGGVFKLIIKFGVLVILNIIVGEEANIGKKIK